jgi:hypothetical protein
MNEATRTYADLSAKERMTEGLSAMGDTTLDTRVSNFVRTNVRGSNILHWLICVNGCSVQILIMRQMCFSAVSIVPLCLSVWNLRVHRVEETDCVYHKANDIHTSLCGLESVYYSNTARFRNGPSNRASTRWVSFTMQLLDET